MYTDSELTQQQDMVVKYSSLVKRIAHHLLSRLPASVQVEDLIQAGMIGLLEASRNYDKNKGASFETYAGIRVRGSMLDEIRKGDWVPRSVHRNARRVSEAIRMLEHQYGRDAKDFEVANALGVDLENYHHMLQDASGSRIILGFEDVGLSDEVFPDSFMSGLSGPSEGFEKDSFQSTLSKEIANLPERERMVLALYYDEELNLREIGEILGVTQSRVCQIHSQAMLRLRARMKDWDYSS